MEVFSPNHTKRWIQLEGLDVNGVYEISVAGKTRYGVGKSSMKIHAGKNAKKTPFSCVRIQEP